MYKIPCSDIDGKPIFIEPHRRSNSGTIYKSDFNLNDDEIIYPCRIYTPDGELKRQISPSDLKPQRGQIRSVDSECLDCRVKFTKRWFFQARCLDCAVVQRKNTNKRWRSENQEYLKSYEILKYFKKMRIVICVDCGKWRQASKSKARCRSCSRIREKRKRRYTSPYLGVTMSLSST